MTPQELKAVLDSHARWLDDPATGRQANLTGASLRWANLSGADLTGADLSGAAFTAAKLGDILLVHLTARLLRGETFTL